MSKVWSRSGTAYFPTDTSDEVELLPLGVYSIGMSMKGIYLDRVSDDFAFSYKIYGKDSTFVDRVVRTVEHTPGNTGVLLNGVKGTGKTVSAKQIANKLKMPVILMTQNFGDNFLGQFGEFINANIKQHVCLFFDEFEKVYPSERGSSPNMLTLMDGVFNSNFKKVFLMTTNELRLNDSFLERPSRIRYIKSYGDLELPVIEEIVDDLLVHKELREATIEFISKLNIITIDIIKEILKEVNIHQEAPDVFKDIFNVKSKEVTYDVSIKPEGGDIMDNTYHYSLQKYHITLPNFSKLINARPSDIITCLNRYQDEINCRLDELDFFVRGNYAGRFHKVINEDEAIFIISREDYDDEDSEVEESDVETAFAKVANLVRKKKITKIFNRVKIEKNEGRHGSFHSYAF